MNGGRIRRVKFKDGRPDLHILHTPTPDCEGTENWRGKLVGNARTMADNATDECPLVGYVILTVYGDGSHNCALRVDDSLSWLPRTLWPAFIEELVRRYMVTKAQAGDTFLEMFEWNDGRPGA